MKNARPPAWHDGSRLLRLIIVDGVLCFMMCLLSCLHMTRVGTIPVDLVIPDLNVEQRYMMVIKIETMIVP